MIYLIGSLRNPRVPEVANELRREGFEVFDDWYAAGPEADDKWQAYEQQRGNSYNQALDGYAANHVYEYDAKHLMRADTAVLLAPAGKSSYLELGWAIGSGRRGFILMEQEPERWDVMVLFATGVYTSVESLVFELKHPRGQKILTSKPGEVWYTVGRK